MKFAIATVSALLLGFASVSAQAEPIRDRSGPAIERGVPDAALGVHDDPAHTVCPENSASEGNANQQNFPVKQYGQTSGGTRC